MPRLRKERIMDDKEKNSNVIDLISFAEKKKSSQDDPTEMDENEYANKVRAKRAWAIAGLQHALTSSVAMHLESPNWATPENWTLCDDDDGNMAQTLMALQVAHAMEDFRDLTESVRTLITLAPSMFRDALKDGAFIDSITSRLSVLIQNDPVKFADVIKVATRKSDED